MVKTVKLILSEPLLIILITFYNLSSHLTNSQKSFPLITVKVTCIKWLPLSSGRKQLFQGPSKLFFIVLPSVLISGYF